jgi:signal peptidase
VLFVGVVVKGVSILALVLVITLFVLTAQVLVTQIQPREEYALGESATGMMPSDRVRQSQISIYPDHVSVDIAGVRWANFSSTGSMLPVLGEGANALQVVPKFSSDIKVGDIISYKLNGRVIIHRVIEAGSDEEGTYFIAKGDNNPEPDPMPVRFSQIDRVVVGILY